MESASVVSPAWLAERTESVTVVDVREERDFREMGHVPGAVNVPFERFRDPGNVAEGMLPDPEQFAEVLGAAGIGSEDTIVAYDDDRGGYAARFLLTAAVSGHRGDLFLLDGDYTVWHQSNSIERGEVDPTPTDYAVDPPEETPVIGREAVEDAVESETLLVDTRTPAEYDQAHIPGAVQLSWETLVDDETGRLKSRADIE
ncbi:MAG: 3-mercaptopyruvate sulfurtransferase SseA, partial [Haloarculaceae archaeon]